MSLTRQAVFACDTCAARLEVMVPCDCEGTCELSCCGNPMKLMDEKTADAANEKHVPLVEKIDGGYKVTVGSTLHPMTDEHWIQLIELQLGDKVYKQYLNPGDEPIATFLVAGEGTPIAREHCNLHGLWKGAM